MKRKIIRIDEEKCTGCGLCTAACDEGALQIVDGKAKLISESYCDGLGNCLPECPAQAIEIIEREASPFDPEAVKQHLQTGAKPLAPDLPCGCPGTLTGLLETSSKASSKEAKDIELESQLRQWPCQIKLVPVNAPYFDNANLLVAADCTAYAYANIHNDFMRNKITLIGCPKLDAIDYGEKLADILRNNELKSVTVLRMEVPCCSGIANAVRQALIDSGKMIPWRVITIATNGEIVED